MEKKLFIVYGFNSNEEKALCVNLVEEIPLRNRCVVCVRDAEYRLALKHILEALKSQAENNYQTALVVFAGDNIHELSKDLPCPCVNMRVVKERLIKKNNGFKTEADKKAVGILFTEVMLNIWKRHSEKNSVLQ